MKKRLIFGFFTILLILAFTLPTALTFADSTDGLKDPYFVFEDFSTRFKDRSAGTTGESNAADYIAEALSSIKNTSGQSLVGLNGNSKSDFIDQFTTTVTDASTGKDRTISSKNVVGYLRSGKANAKLLVVCCEYGNAYSLVDAYGDAYKSEGAYEFSTSVAALLNIAYRLRSVNLSFDVAFAFFGAGCYQSRGVERFISQNQQQLLGVIDLYAVGGGDDLNVYYDEIPTAHGKFLDERIAKFSYAIKTAPFDKKYITSDVDVFTFRHVGLMSSNYYFLKEGVPSVELFGYAWNTFGNRESSTYGNVLGTSSDTLSYMKTNYGEDRIRERLTLVSDFVVGSISTDKDISAAFSEYKGGYGGLTNRSVYWIFTGVALGLVAILFAVGVIVYSKKTDNAPTPDFGANDKVFEEDNESSSDDDIFGFSDPDPIIVEPRQENTEQNDNDDNNKNNDRDDDDIFGEF